MQRRSRAEEGKRRRARYMRGRWAEVQPRDERESRGPDTLVRAAVRGPPRRTALCSCTRRGNAAAAAAETFSSPMRALLLAMHISRARKFADKIAALYMRIYDASLRVLLLTPRSRPDIYALINIIYLKSISVAVPRLGHRLEHRVQPQDG